MCIACACVLVFLPFFWCILDTYYEIVPSCLKNLSSFGWEIECVILPKLHACFHVLCVHLRMCMQKNIINQFRRPIGTTLKVLWISDFIWLRYSGVSHLWQKRDKQTNPQTNKQTQVKFIFDSHILTISQCHTHTFSKFHILPISHYHNLTISHFHNLTVNRVLRGRIKDLSLNIINCLSVSQWLQQ